MHTDNSRPDGSSTVPKVVLVVLLLLVVWLTYRIIRPYLDPIVLAVILAGIIHPLFRWLRRRLGGRPNLAALVTCLIVVVVILGPVAVMVTALIKQGIDTAQTAQQWINDGKLEQAIASAPTLQQIGPLVHRILPGVNLESIDLQGLIMSASQSLGKFLLTQGKAFLSGTGTLVVNLLLMVFVLFYVLRDGEELLAKVLHLLPLRATQKDKLLRRIRSVSRSAILGTFATAAAQGVAGGIGLAIVGIPALFWGTMMAFASLIPVVGTTLIWGPACIYLALTGSWVKAVVLLVYCAVVVGSIDNFLRPVLMQGEAQMSTLWIFFAILGGLQAFGLLGLIYGPVVFGLLAVLLFLYQTEFQDFLDRQDAT